MALWRRCPVAWLLALFGVFLSADAAFAQTVLAVKFVAFRGPASPALSRRQAEELIQSVDREYAPCGLSLVLGEYQEVDPAKLGLPYRLSSMDQLDQIRGAFQDNRYLVVIDTGPWDHEEMGPANAWTTMPRTLPAGAVLEDSVASNAPVIAHELGHYLGLEHVSDLTDMMSSVIYADSTHILRGQCQEMVHSARADHVLALR